MKTRNYSFVLKRLSTILATSILALSSMAAITGILISFYYEPTAGGAYNSLSLIESTVSFGWLIQRIHSLAGNSLIVVSLIAIIVMFLGRKFRYSWLTSWISGILLTLTAIALAWTAILLDWTQIGYWRFTIEIGIIESIPYIGSILRELIVSGDAVNTMTVSRLYTFHSYILSGGALILSLIHLGGLLFSEQEEKQILSASNLEVSFSDLNQ